MNVQMAWQTLLKPIKSNYAMKIIKVPSSCGALGKKDGVDLAPDEIARNLPRFYLKENGLLPIFEIDEVKVSNSDIEETNSAIGKKISEQDTQAIILGGDHSLTYPAFSAFAKTRPNAGILIFDAHPDCEDDFRPPTHEDFVRVLITQGIVKKENVIMIGIRNMHANELDFIKGNKLKIYNMKELIQEGIRKTCDAVMSVAMKFDNLYVSVDIDVLDPACAPGTGYPEPGGMSVRQLLYMLQRIRLLRNWRMMDLVEVNPKKDMNSMTVSSAAKIVVEMS
jgi:arginase family enzyme